MPPNPVPVPGGASHDLVLRFDGGSLVWRCCEHEHVQGPGETVTAAYLMAHMSAAVAW